MDKKELDSLKRLLRNGPKPTNEIFFLMEPRSSLYKFIVYRDLSSPSHFRANCLCLIDDKSVRINTIYENATHKVEIEKFAKRIGRKIYKFSIQESDYKTMAQNSQRSDRANWRVFRRVADVPPAINIQTLDGLVFPEITRFPGVAGGYIWNIF